MSDPGDNAASPPLRDEEAYREQAGTVKSSPDYMSIKDRCVILETPHCFLTTLVNK